MQGEAKAFFFYSAKEINKVMKMRSPYFNSWSALFKNLNYKKDFFYLKFLIRLVNS